MNVLCPVNVVTVGNYSEEDNRSTLDNNYCSGVIARRVYFTSGIRTEKHVLCQVDFVSVCNYS
jgi:hypothetical protein